MLTITELPASSVTEPTKYEAEYTGLDELLGPAAEWTGVERSCPIEAAADSLNNALFWLRTKEEDDAKRRRVNGKIATRRAER